VSEKKSPLLDQAMAGVDDPGFRSLLADEWEWSMRWAPTWATTLGDHRYDDQLAPGDPEAIARYLDEQRALLARTERLDASQFNESDRVSYALFVGQLRADVGAQACRLHEWEVSARSNPYTGLGYELGEGHRVVTPADAKNLLARLGKVKVAFDDAIANLRIGLASGLTAPRESVRRTVAQLDGELEKSSAEWAFSLPAKAPHPDWPEGEQKRFADALQKLVDNDVRAAVVRYRDVLRDEIMPHARVDAKEGLKGLPLGDACYRKMIGLHLDMERDPRELHELGLAQIAVSDREIAALGQKLFGKTDLTSTVSHLREARELYFANREELVKAANEAVARAQAALPEWFLHLPEQPCVVREVPAHEAPYTTIAYYREPHYDGTKPGEYFVNTYKPETRPSYDFAALSYHEAIPGHHLQIALAQELGALPLFRKFRGSTAFIEGWALYTERLADEMGLYASDVDRLGMWSYDAWRSARLVVDTGLHALGWTRQQAEAFMLAHTALTPDNVSNEVDRYISSPGQALSYKVGQLELLMLREHARAALGEAFDVRAFHDAVLGAGGVTLPVLHQRVHAYTSALGGKPVPCACGFVGG
jgi:uncharacterized protein (DUF885 family)